MDNLHSINISQKTIDDIYGEYSQANFPENDSINIFETESDEDIITDEYDSSDWEEVDIKTKKTGFWGLGGKQGYYKAPNGMELKFDLSDDVIIKRNKNTGEIFINNAKNLVVNGTDKDDNLTISGCEIKEIKTKDGDDTLKIINNSHMAISITDKFNTGKGNDTVLIKDSTITEGIKTGDGNDKIIAQKSNLNEVLTQNGNDSVKLNNVIALNIDLGKGLNRTEVNNSDIENLTGGKDNDVFFINNSFISNETDTGSGDDSVIITNKSNIAKLDTNSGDDSVYVQDSTITNAELGSNNDIINTYNTLIESLNAGNGTDNIALFMNTTIKKLDCGKGNDTIISDNNNVKIYDMINGENITETKNKINVQGLAADDTVAEQAISAGDNIFSEYTQKNLTPKEQFYALTIDMFNNQLENIKAQFNNQENSDGVVGDTYNIIKTMLDMGITNDEIKNAIAEQEKMIKEMETALNSKDSSNFEQVFKKWTGIEYNEKNISEFLEYQQAYNFAVISETKISNFVENIYRANTLGDVLDLYKDYYGDEETARNKLNEVLNKIPIIGSYISDSKIKINENNQIESTDNESHKYAQKDCSLDKYQNIINQGSINLSDLLIEDYEKAFENLNGYSVDTLQDIYLSKQVSAMGAGTSFQKLIDKYCTDQNTIENRVGSIVQIGGIAMMAGGGLLTFVCPIAGASIMKAGSYTAFAGTFLDNGLDVLDSATSEEGITEEKARELFKETLIDAALYLSGRFINGIAEGVNSAVTATAAANGASKSLQTIIGWTSQVGVDTTLSMIADLAITGEIDLAGEGLSQLLGIISGIAGAKVNSYYKESFDVADSRISNNDIDGAYDYLKSRGISDKKIYNTYNNMEQSRILDYYKQTGDYDGALRMVETSKILSYDLFSAKQTLNDVVLSAEQTKVEKMITDGADIDTVTNYINNSPILTEADLGYFEDIMPKLTEEVINKKLNNIDIPAESKIKLAKNLDINRINKILNSDNPQKQAIDTVNKIEDFQTKIRALMGDSADIDLITEFMFKNSTWVDSQAQFEITQTQLERIQSIGATRENTYILAPQPNKELKSYTNAARDLIEISQSSQLKLNPNNTRCEIDLSKIPGEQHIIISDDCSVSGSSMIEDMINKLATTGEIDGTKTISIVPTVIGAQAEENISDFIRLFNQISESDMTRLVNSIKANNNLSEDMFYQTVSSSLSGKSKEMFDILYKVTDKKIKTRLPELSQNLLSLVSAQNQNGKINFELIDGIKAANFQNSTYYNNLTETQQNEIYSLLSANGQSFGYNDSATDIIIEGYKGSYDFDSIELGEEAKKALGIGETLPDKGNAPNNNTIIAQIFAEAIGIPLSRIKISGYTTPETYFELIKQDLTTVPQGVEKPIAIEINTRNNNYNNSYTINKQKYKAGDTIIITYKDIYGNPCEPIEFTLPEIKGQEDPLIFFKNYWDSYNENSSNFKIVQGTSNAAIPKADNTKNSLVEGKLDQYIFAFDITVDGRTINIEKAN